ncbi:MAG TPA: transaldolase family protein [Chloroflexota bacterium]|nr:transaldolase family protein [Chloroflexota bacterium]
MTKDNRLRLLEARGVSVWQEGFTRRELTSGQLGKLVADDGLSGVTFNLVPLHAAISRSTDDDATIARLAQQGQDAPAIVDALIVTDARDAADVLLPVWEQTNGHDGFVSLDVPIWLVYDSQACLAEAHRLRKAIDRPNLMVRIPGLDECIPAIRQCLVDGLNVNVSSLSSVARYATVVEAYLHAIETRLVRGLSVERVASVASFLVGPVDALVDRAIMEKLQTASGATSRTKLENLVGKVGIANAKLAYQTFSRVFSPADARWDKLVGGGAQPSRLAWTGLTMPEPTRRDVLYVEDLIASRTVATLSPTTLDAFREHGEVRGDTATEGVDEAAAILQEVADAGIDLTYLSRQLTDDVSKQVEAAYPAVLADVTQKLGAFPIGRPTSQRA